MEKEIIGQMVKLEFHEEKRDSEGLITRPHHARVQINFDLDVSEEDELYIINSLLEALQARRVLTTIAPEQTQMFGALDSVEMTHISPTGKTETASLSIEQAQKAAKTIQGMIDEIDAKNGGGN